MMLNRCKKLAQHPLSGDWFRAVALQHYHSRLSTEHTRIMASRFKGPIGDDPPHRILYLAEHHQVAMYEVGAMYGPPAAPISDPKLSWLTLSLRVRLGRVVDLCEEGQRAIIGTTYQELTGDWASSPGTAPTQSLGTALYQSPRLEGFLFPSARVGGKILVVFPDKLDPLRSSIVFRNDLTDEAERLA